MMTEHLETRKVYAKSVPKMLTDEQRDTSVKMCQKLLDRIRHDSNFLENVITGDKQCIFEYEPKTKSQNSEHLHLISPQKTRTS